jgi:flavodoxin
MKIGCMMSLKNEGKSMEETNTKILIAYYSRTGQNYAKGRITNLVVGNTAIAAGFIQEYTNGTLFQIETVKSYPMDYTETTKIAQKEFRGNERPELTNTVVNMDEYAVIFLGYPNWWGTMPMAVFTFLEAYDLSKKTIIPFCTHEGSGLGNSERDIAKLCPDARILKGLAIKGSDVREAKNNILVWVKKSLK